MESRSLRRGRPVAIAALFHRADQRNPYKTSSTPQVVPAGYFFGSLVDAPWWRSDHLFNEKIQLGFDGIRAFVIFTQLNITGRYPSHRRSPVRVFWPNFVDQSGFLLFGDPPQSRLSQIVMARTPAGHDKREDIPHGICTAGYDERTQLRGYSENGDLTVTVQVRARILQHKSSERVDTAKLVQQCDCVYRNNSA
jgi:hypothetical protein